MKPEQCDPYMCFKCRRVYLYLDLMGDPECECGAHAWLPVQISKQIVRVLEHVPEEDAEQVPASWLVKAHDDAEVLRQAVKRVAHEIDEALEADEQRFRPPQSYPHFQLRGH